MTRSYQAWHRRSIEREADGPTREWYGQAPTTCAECGGELKNHHPDDPPVHAGECEDAYFGRNGDDA